MAEGISKEEISALLQAQLRWVEDGGKPAEGPFMQAVALENIARHEVSYNNGDTFALIEAIYHCSCHGLKMPEWVATEFRHGYQKILACDAKSLGEVFGDPFPKGKHLNALRKKRNLRFVVWNRVHDLLGSDPSIPIDRDLFKRVGKEISPPVGGSEAEKLYYEAKKMMPFSHDEVGH